MFKLLGVAMIVDRLPIWLQQTDLSGGRSEVRPNGGFNRFLRGFRLICLGDAFMHYVSSLHAPLDKLLRPYLTSQVPPKETSQATGNKY